jgi:hypothetical protein
MATLAIAGIGAAVGWGVGGTATAMAIGWTVGSYVGQYLFPTQLPDVEGPRVTDLNASTSAYGIAQTRVFGTSGVAGNLIWSDELTEIRNEEEVGGKGGGGTEQTVVNYTYQVTCAYALCEGPVSAVRRIWFDADLVYDERDTNTGISIKEGVNIRVYLGGENQGPDPDIQQIEGIANTPAYRGTCYIVISDLLLTEYGNRRPNVRAEVVRQTVGENPQTIIGNDSYNDIYIDRATGWLGLSDLVADTQVIFDADAGVVIAEWDIPQAPALGSWSPQGMYNGILYGSGWYDGNNQFIGSLDAISGAILWQSEAYGIGDVLTGRIEVHSVGTYAYVMRYGILTPQGQEIMEINGDGSLTTITQVNPIAGQGQSEMGAVENDTGNVWCMHTTAGGGGAGISVTNLTLNPDYPYFSPTKFLFTTQQLVLTNHFDSAGEPISPPATGVKADNFYTISDFLAYDASTQSIIIQQSNDDSGTALPEGLYRLECPTRYDLSTMRIAAKNTSAEDYGTIWTQYQNNYNFYNGNALRGDGLVYYVTSGASQAVLHEFNTLDLSYNRGIDWTLTNLLPFNGIADWNSKYMFANVSGSGTVKLVWDRWPDDGEPLDQVVKDICEAHSLDASEFDVSDLATKTVKGFSIGRPTKARTQIEALMGAYFFDAVESDKKLKFRLRDNTSIVSIPEDDLAAHEPGQQLPDGVLLKRKELYQLPQTVQVTHVSRELEYEPSSQYARQPTSPTEHVFKLEFPLVLSDDEAAQIAEIWMQSLRSERHTGTIELGPKYFEYDPTDIVQVSNDSLNFTFRLLKTALGGLPGITKAEVSTYDVSAYTSTAKGSSPIGYFSASLAKKPITAFYLMNCPPLRDTDDDGGFYIAVNPYVSANTWPGAVVKRRSLDSEGTVFVSIKTAFSRATTGFENSSTALPAGPNATTWDWENTIDVKLFNPSIDSLTTETELSVLNGANVLYFPKSGELMQYQVATDNGDDTWTLSGLLRGRKGTDVFMDNHLQSEPFVVIDPNKMYKVTDDLSNIGRTFEYGAVTLNATDASAPKSNWTQTGGLITPLSPVDLVAERQANDDLALSWVRRARLNAEWLDNIDVPLDEPTEEYDVELYSGGTLLRTVRVIGANSYTYTLADQTTDFGQRVGNFNMTVYQISSRIGRGQPGYLVDFKESQANDFSGYALDQEPPEFWDPLPTLAFNEWVIKAGGADQVVRHTRGSAAHIGLLWQAVSPGRDVEALIKTTTTINDTTGGVGTQSIHGVLVRGDALNAGYFAGFWGDTGTASLVYKSTGTPAGYVTLYNSPSKKLVSGQFWWIRLNVQGDQIKCKWWNDSGNEPDFWDVELTDTTEPNSGNIMLMGAYQYWGGPELYDFFSVAYDGRTAPSTV